MSENDEKVVSSDVSPHDASSGLCIGCHVRPAVPWRKVLWEKQPYPTNHVDSTFLAELVTNANVQNYDLWSLMTSTAAVTQQALSIVMFFIVFIYTAQQSLSINVLLGLDVLLIILGYSMLALFHKPPEFRAAIKSFLLFPSMLSMLTPVLRTLTRSFSEDTIWALSGALSVIHLAFHDYIYSNTTVKRFSGTISLNAIGFTSVLLSSRLASNDHVFAFELFAFELFGLFPLTRHYIKMYSMKSHLVVTLLMFLGTFVALWIMSPIAAAILSISVFFVTFICPVWLLYLQSYKNEIRGPWDIAIAKFD